VRINAMGGHDILSLMQNALLNKKTGLPRQVDTPDNGDDDKDERGADGEEDGDHCFMVSMSA
jgi:hypothetical protein